MIYPVLFFATRYFEPFVVPLQECFGVNPLPLLPSLLPLVFDGIPWPSPSSWVFNVSSNVSTFALNISVLKTKKATFGFRRLCCCSHFALETGYPSQLLRDGGGRRGDGICTGDTRLLYLFCFMHLKQHAWTGVAIPLRRL